MEIAYIFTFLHFYILNMFCFFFYNRDTALGREQCAYFIWISSNNDNIQPFFGDVEGNSGITLSSDINPWVIRQLMTPINVKETDWRSQFHFPISLLNHFTIFHIPI